MWIIKKQLKLSVTEGKNFHFNSKSNGHGVKCIYLCVFNFLYIGYLRYQLGLLNHQTSTLVDLCKLWFINAMAEILQYSTLPKGRTSQTTLWVTISASVLVLFNKGWVAINCQSHILLWSNLFLIFKFGLRYAALLILMCSILQWLLLIKLKTFH